jgi:hypothetical protein
LGYRVLFRAEEDIFNKVSQFKYTCRKIAGKIKDESENDCAIELYETLALPALIYDSETWTV